MVLSMESARRLYCWFLRVVAISFSVTSALTRLFSRCWLGNVGGETVKTWTQLGLFRHAL